MRLPILLATLTLAAPALAAEPEGASTTAAAPQPEGASTTAAAPQPESASTTAAPPPALATTTAPARARPAMVEIPGGSYTLGEPGGIYGDTGSIVRVSTFLLDATEVTVSAYAACVRAGRCAPAATTVQMEGLPAAEAARWSAACNGDRPDRAEHPVNCVDWSQAQAYCAFAGKRLPSEAEWEWAARGGGAGIAYPWGNDPPGDRVCWGGPGNETAGPRSGTCPVATHPRGATPSGVQDLAGNVWEWTSSEDVVAADSRGRGGTPVKIARGGGWSSTTPAQLTAAIRAKDLPTMRAADLGFRCARSR